MVADYLITPRDWQAEAIVRAAKLSGTPEGDTALVEAKRYGALADQIERLRALAAGATRGIPADAITVNLVPELPELLCDREKWERYGASCYAAGASAGMEKAAQSIKQTPYGPAILLDDVRDAMRYRWLRADLSRIDRRLWPKRRLVACPDGIPGCMVAHFAPVALTEIDAVIDAAAQKGAPR